MKSTRITILLLISAAILAGCQKESSSASQPDKGQTETEQSENGQSENGQSENGQSGNGQSENGQSENGQSENGQTPLGRPTDFEMGSRAVASWCVPEGTYLKVLDLEVLRDNPEQIDQDLLKRLLTIHTSSVDGRIQYDFTEGDKRQTIIEGLVYDFQEGQISLKVKYKGVTSKNVSRLQFQAGKYYSLRFPIDQDYVSSHYMSGIHQHVGQFVGSILRIDDERYMPGAITSKGKDDIRNSMTFTFKVHDTIRNEEIIEITKDLNGFLTVQQLASAMRIIPTHEVLEAARAAIKAAESYPGKNLLQVLRLKFGSQRWMEMMHYELDGIALEYTDSPLTGSTHTGSTLIGSGDRLDVYLENLRWYLKAAKLENGVLTLEILLEGANGIVLKDISYLVEMIIS